jgi:membrane carboxypeptidase/penicillin-binding protein
MMSVRADVVSNSEQSQYTNTTPYVVEDTRETMNRILAEASLSPVRSQVRTTLQNQSKSSLRRLLSKLTRGARTLQGMLRITLRTYNLSRKISNFRKAR